MEIAIGALVEYKTSYGTFEGEIIDLSADERIALVQFNDTHEMEEIFTCDLTVTDAAE